MIEVVHLPVLPPQEPCTGVPSLRKTDLLNPFTDVRLLRR